MVQARRGLVHSIRAAGEIAHAAPPGGIETPRFVGIVRCAKKLGA
jgi:hypothetical protein